MEGFSKVTDFLFPSLFDESFGIIRKDLFVENSVVFVEVCFDFQLDYLQI